MLSDVLLLTGMPSPGKTRLAAALNAAGLTTASAAGTLHVHAESDLEALLDPSLRRAIHAAQANADLTISVEWESTAESVRRVMTLVSSRYDTGSSQDGV
jgi:predicted ATPase